MRRHHNASLRVTALNGVVEITAYQGEATATFRLSPEDAETVAEHIIHAAWDANKQVVDLHVDGSPLAGPGMDPGHT